MKSTETASNVTSLRTWIINHDESRAFIAAYIGLAVVLSAFVSLFWLLVVVGVHFCFEYIRQQHLDNLPGSTVGRALWELRLDLALIVFAMVIALYMEFVIGVAGLRLAPRLGRVVAVGSRGTARFAAWSRVLRAILLSLDDAGQLVRAAVMRRSRSNKTDTVEDEEQSPPSPDASASEGGVSTGWGWGDWFIALFFAVSLVLLLLTPILTDHTVASAVQSMLKELHPLP